MYCLVAAGIQLQITDTDEHKLTSSLKCCHTETLGSTKPETLGFGADVQEKFACNTKYIICNVLNATCNNSL